MSNGAKLAIFGSLLGILSIFLPWYEFDLIGIHKTFTPWGYSTAWLLILLAALGIAMAQEKGHFNKKGMAAGTIIMGLLFTLVVIANNPANAGFDFFEKNIGYWIALASGLLMILGGIMKLKQS